MRGHFVETKDVRRIAQSNGLGAFDCRIADHQSVDAKMQLLMASEDSPVLFYRPATADQRLIVVLQTASMKKAMLEHGPYLLATDTTHDTSRYPGMICTLFVIETFTGVLLGTLMTIGAAGEGQPVAFFIITSESEEQLTPVFAAIAQR